jgi:hypothetical protein
MYSHENTEAQNLFIYKHLNYLPIISCFLPKASLREYFFQMNPFGSGKIFINHAF